jgi:hypothetical protein
MNQPASPETKLPPSWAETLDQVRQALHLAEQAAAEREKAFPAIPQPNPAASDFEAKWRQCLERLQERFTILETCAAKADQTAEPADAALEAGEVGIRRWLAEIQNVALTLAEPGIPPVR